MQSFSCKQNGAETTIPSAIISTLCLHLLEPLIKRSHASKFNPTPHQTFSTLLFLCVLKFSGSLVSHSDQPRFVYKTQHRLAPCSWPPPHHLWTFIAKRHDTRKARFKRKLAYVLEWKSQLEAGEKEMKEWKLKISAATTNITKHKNRIDAKKNLITQLNSKKQDILEKCELEQINLPTVADAMDVDSSSGPVFDFDQLSRSLRHNMRPAEREKIEAEFKQKIGNLISEIDRTAPNLKALDQYAVLQEKEREASKEFEEAREEETQIRKQFETVRAKRLTCFMDAFNHISGNIDKIYKELTTSTTHPLGGTAYLNLENIDEPFLHGIKYPTMPPTKRFRDMELLSGGEKTVAALSLLFSIHSYKPSPFFILDEVDAALDNLNVAKVARYIRSKSCGGAQDVLERNGFQSIVISLKDTFYDKAEALVGVYRDSEKGCSRTLTFDLSQYRET